jgi:hypothetical protein
MTKQRWTTDELDRIGGAAAAFAAATVSSRLSRRLGNDLLAVAGVVVVVMLIGTAWMSRIGPSTAYLFGIALPMVIFGVGQGVGLSALTTGGWPALARRTPAWSAASSTWLTTLVGRSGWASSSPSSTPQAPR